MDTIAKIARLFTNGWRSKQVVDGNATTTRLQKRASETNLQTQKPETKGSGDLNGESTTRREVAQQEAENNIQTGEHSSVCLFSFSSYNLFINRNRWWTRLPICRREQVRRPCRCENLRRMVLRIWMENQRREGKLPDRRLEITFKPENTQVYVYSRSHHNNCFINRNRWRTLKPRRPVCRREQVRRTCKYENLRRMVRGIWVESQRWEGKLPNKRLEITFIPGNTQVYVYSRSHHTIFKDCFINRNRWWMLKPWWPIWGILAR